MDLCLPHTEAEAGRRNKLELLQHGNSEASVCVCVLRWGRRGRGESQLDSQALAKDASSPQTTEQHLAAFGSSVHFDGVTSIQNARLKTNTRSFVRMNRHTHTHIYIYMYTCTYTHTHIHMEIHIHTQSQFSCQDLRVPRRRQQRRQRSTKTMTMSLYDNKKRALF